MSTNAYLEMMARAIYGFRMCSIMGYIYKGANSFNICITAWAMGMPSPLKDTQGNFTAPGAVSGGQEALDRGEEGRFHRGTM